MYLQRGTADNVDAPLGYMLLGVNVGVTQVTGDIVIQPEQDFSYYNKRFDKALKDGTITQAVYNAIINNQNASRQVYEIENDLTIDKEELLSLVDLHNVQNVDSGGTIAEIVEDIINENLQIVKKI